MTESTAKRMIWGVRAFKKVLMREKRSARKKAPLYLLKKAAISP